MINMAKSIIGISDTKQRADDIVKHLSKFGTAVIAYSGGVDSTLLLYLAEMSGLNRLIAVTALSETYNETDGEIAKSHTDKLGIEHIFIDSEELNNRNFLDNNSDRCYYCKFELFNKLKTIAKKNSIEYVLDASHFTDTFDHRPGMNAARELGVLSPFKELSWDKETIRNVSRSLEIEGWDRPSTVCLSSRVPYGTNITLENIARIKEAEDFIKGLGIDIVRVRSDGITARIEVIEKEIETVTQKKHRDKINSKFFEIGFKYISIDLEGFKSGKMNRVLNNE